MANAIKDFQIGNMVLHLSNTSIILVVIGIKEQMNEVTCRWIDKKGKIQSADFLPEELAKVKEGQDGTLFMIPDRNKNTW